MKVVALTLLLALSHAFAATHEKTSPITRVVELIQRLKAEIEAESEEEQAIYDKFACWCEETTKRKADAITQAIADIERLGNTILDTKASLATLAAEISQLMADIAQNEKEQKDATALREKENADYNSEKADMEQALNALEKAITVLTGAGAARPKAAVSEAAFLAAATNVRSAFHRMDASRLSTKDSQTLQAFLSNPSRYTSLLSAPSFKAHYAQQSMTIQGILKDMYDTFASDLGNANKDEASAQEQYESVMAVKAQELANFKKTLARKQQDEAAAGEVLAQAQQDMQDTKEQLAIDQEFFHNTKESCQAKAKAWENRKSMRAEELKGINEAIEILSSDDAREIFHNSSEVGGWAFAQVSDVSGGPIAHALSLLKKAAGATHSIRLAALAAKVRTQGRFDLVLVEIDKLIGDLRNEGLEDVKHRDWCKKTEHDKTMEGEHLVWQIGKLGKKIGLLDSQITKLDEEITQTGLDITEIEEQKKTAQDVRNTEHQRYQAALKDDNDAVALIDQAIDALARFYGNHSLGRVDTVLAQKPEFDVNPDDMPDTGKIDHDYTGRAGEQRGIIAILNVIRGNIEREIAESNQAEADSAAAYEKFVADADASIAVLTKKASDLGLDKAEKESEKQTTEGEKTNKEGENDAVVSFLTEIKPNCEFILKHFESRASMRAKEKEALEDAKSILSGADFAASQGGETGFLQDDSDDDDESDEESDEDDDDSEVFLATKTVKKHLRH